MFDRSQAFYDAVYSFKDYPGEADSVTKLIKTLNPSARTLLDVACGTGMHLAEFKKNFEVEGVDKDPVMLEIASARLKGALLHTGDMQTFHLDRKFDVVVCLFSSIGYCHTTQELNQAVTNLANHLNPGGVLIIEPWIEPEKYIVGNLSSLFVDREGLKVARFTISSREGDLCIHHFHYLVATPSEINHFEERHVMGLFTDNQYRESLKLAGIEPQFDEVGLIGRGLYYGVKA